MSELAPARGRQGAKGTSLAMRAMREPRAAFSLPTCSLAAQVKVGRTPQAGEGFRVVWRGCISIESLKTQSRRL